MYKLKMAALLAATVLGAASADAATIVRYDVTATGQRFGFSTSTGAPLPTIDMSFTLTYLFEASVGSFTFNRVDTADGFISKSGSYELSDNGVSLRERHQQTRLDRVYRTSFCADTSAGFPTSFSGTPSCGNMSIEYSDVNQGNPIAYQFAGKVTNLVASTFEGDLDVTGFGVVNAAAAVPEPATWAMMLMGFALTGYAMRRRRVTLATA